LLRESTNKQNDQEINKMYALSVKEPWLSMIANGIKTIETRTWRLARDFLNRDILLVGSKKPKGKFSGKAACVVQVTECRRMKYTDVGEACCPVYPGAVAWKLANVRLVKPFPITGSLGLYQVDDKKIELTEDDILW